MVRVPTIFQTCTPRPEVLAGELPDAIFAADLWDVVCRKPGTHPDYLDPARFFDPEISDADLLAKSTWQYENYYTPLG